MNVIHYNSTRHCGERIDGAVVMAFTREVDSMEACCICEALNRLRTTPDWLEPLLALLDEEEGEALC